MDRTFDPAAQGASNTAASQRGQARDSMFMNAIVQRADGTGEALTLRVRNLSAGGVMVETPEPFVHGEAVRVELRNVGEVGGRIAWLRGGRIGIAFDRLIDPRKARKPQVQSPGATMTLVKAVKDSRRPGLKIG